MTHSTIDRAPLVKSLKSALSTARYQHCLRVEEAGVNLAQHWELDEDLTQKVSLASLMHDFAKELDLSLMKELAYRYEPSLKDYPNLTGAILHGPAAASLLEDEFNCYDQSILKAVASHTIGDFEMDVVSKIVFLADYIEEERDFPGVEKARELAYSNLDQAVVYKMSQSISYLAQSCLEIFPKSIAIYNKWIRK